ncbi:MAG: rhomboid family intramembrane serine protease [Fimbriiglobus sp.]
MASPESEPEPADVLRWCAAAAPAAWFPSAHAAAHGIPRDALDHSVWLLQRAGWVHVADWVRGRGQGFALTPEGKAALADPAKALASPPPPAPPPPGPAAGDTTFDRGERARAALLFTDSAAGTASFVLMAVCVAWFLVGTVVAWQAEVPVGIYLYGRGDGVAGVALRIGAAFGMNLILGEWWRLLSCAFVHYGIVHLAGNMLVLGTTGPVVERWWGRWRFLVIYLVSGLAGSCLAMALHPSGAIAGASGAVWGVMTAMLAWLLRYRQHLPGELLSEWLQRLGLVVLLNAAFSMIPGVSWEGHLGGGLAGFALAWLLDFARPGAGWKQVAAWVGVAVVTALGPVGLLVAIDRSAAWQPFRVVANFRKLLEQRPPVVVPEPGPVGPADPVSDAHNAATLAMLSGNPALRADAQARIAGVRAVLNFGDPVAVGSDAVDEKLRAYRAAANDLLDGLDAVLALARPPTAAEWQALGKKVRAVQAAQRALAPP